MKAVTTAPGTLIGGARSLFYGWWITIAGSVSMAVSAGFSFYGFGSFVVPLTEDLETSRTAISGVISVSRLEAGMLGPVEGYAVDRFGPRKMMLIGMPLVGIGFLLFSRVESVLMLYLVYLPTIALGTGLAFSTPITACIANWFRAKRSRAFGFLWSGIAIGGGIFVPVLGWMIENQGWRFAAVVAGISLMAVGIPVALMMRRSPEDYGLLPDGIKPSPQTAEAESGKGFTAATAQGVDEGPELTPWEALRTPVFWFLGLSISMRGMVTSGMVVHVVAMMQDRGMSLTVASTMLASVATISIVGRLGVGWLGDIWDKRLLMAGTMAALTLTMIGMSLVTVLVPMLCILAVYAVAYGGTTVLPMSLQADLFGRKSYATIRGLVHTVQMTGMLLGPVFAGFVYDQTQSYFLAFVGFAIAGFVGMVAILITLFPRFGPVTQHSLAQQRKAG